MNLTSSKRQSGGRCSGEEINCENKIIRIDTDFIFATLVEELGLIGGLIL